METRKRDTRKERKKNVCRNKLKREKKEREERERKKKQNQWHIKKKTDIQPNIKYLRKGCALLLTSF